MRSRIFIVGTGVLGALALASLLGLVTGRDGFAAGALVVLVAVVGLLALAGVVSQRRVGRRVDYLYRKGGPVQRAESEAAPAVAQDDLVGMLRLVQAQYVGRLDSALGSLERATEHLLTAGTDGAASGTRPTLTVEPRDEYAPAVEAAIGAGIEVTVLDTADASAWVERRGWQGQVSLAGPMSPSPREP